MNSIHYMYWGEARMETIRETFYDELPDREQLELEIESVEMSIARLKETPYIHSLEQKQERLAQLVRVLAEAYGKG